VGHHGGHGTTVAAMVHHVLSIYMSFVLELYVKYTFLPNKIFYCSRAIYPTRSMMDQATTSRQAFTTQTRDHYSTHQGKGNYFVRRVATQKHNGFSST
jgi:hypothetical protein